MLGRGAFAEVWEATRPDGATVALKFLDARARNSSGVAAEVRLLRNLTELKHPNIIHLHGVVPAANYVVLVMERATCNLSDLRDAYVRDESRNVPPEHALQLL